MKSQRVVEHEVSEKDTEQIIYVLVGHIKEVGFYSRWEEKLLASPQTSSFLHWDLKSLYYVSMPLHRMAVRIERDYGVENGIITVSTQSGPLWNQISGTHDLVQNFVFKSVPIGRFLKKEDREFQRAGPWFLRKTVLPMKMMGISYIKYGLIWSLTPPRDEMGLR